MSNTPLHYGAIYEENGANEAASTGLVIGTGWTQVVAATSFEYEGFWLNINSSGTSDRLFDIAIGGSGSEEILIEDIYSSRCTSGREEARHKSLFIPIKIPAGSRIACRSSNACQATILGVNGAPGRMVGFAGALTWGQNGTNGTEIDAGSSTNTRGSWVEFIASTETNIKALMVCMGINGNSSATNADYLFNVAIGASGSEEIILENIPLTTGSSSDQVGETNHGAFPVDIPAGTRISMCLQSTTSNSTDRKLDAILYGFY